MQSGLQVAFPHPSLQATRVHPHTYTPTHALITQLIINQRLGSILSSLQMREHPSAEKRPENAGLTTKKRIIDSPTRTNQQHVISAGLI